MRIAGATVHFVDEETDHGPIILQGAVAVGPGRHRRRRWPRRILEVEHEIYPAAIQLFAEGRLIVEGRRVRIAGEAPRLAPTLARAGERTAVESLEYRCYEARVTVQAESVIRRAADGVRDWRQGARRLGGRPG